MDVSRYHSDTQKVLHQALQIARQYGHAFLEIEHVALSLVKGDFLGSDVRNRPLMADFLSRHLEKSPRIYGLKRITFGRRLRSVFEKIESIYDRVDIFTLWRELVQASTLLKMLIQENDNNEDSTQLLEEAKEAHDSRIVREHHSEHKSGSSTEHPVRSKKTSQKKSLKKVESFVVDLTHLAEEGQLFPIFGRDKEMKEVLQVLGRLKKNNPLLIGDPGVGKSALAEGVALWLIQNPFSDILKHTRVLSVDIAALIAGTKYRGEFEERMKALLDLAADDPGRYIFFIDEAHMMIGAGNHEGGADIANLLKPALARGVFRCIAATTYAEYKLSIQNDAALARRFQIIFIEEPSREGAIDILRGLKPLYEKHHQVMLSNEVLESAVDLSIRYLPSLKLPDKALDLIDEVASHHKMGPSSNKKEITKDEMVEFVEKKFGVSVAFLDSKAIRTRWLDIEERLAQRVYGQRGALKRLGKAIRRAQSGLIDPKKPRGSFVFWGPQGVGKQEVAKALAVDLFSDESRLVTIDLSEYTQESSLNRLIGSPPGLLGYDEGGLLTDLMRKKPFSVIYFENIDLAHGCIVSLIVQILESGKIIDRQGRIADFTNSFLLFGLTWQDSHGQLWEQEGASFQWKDVISWAVTVGDHETRKKMSRIIRPDLVSNVNEIIPFRNLSSVHLRKILGKFEEELNQQLQEKNLKIKMGQKFIDFLIRQGQRLGSSGLRYLFTQHVLNELAERLLLEMAPITGVWCLDLDDGEQVVWTPDLVDAVGMAS